MPLGYEGRPRDNHEFSSVEMFKSAYFSCLLFQIHCEGKLKYNLNHLDDAVDHKYSTEGGVSALGQERRHDGEQEVDEGKEPLGNGFHI